MLKIEYIYFTALLITGLQLITFFTSLEFEIKGWNKDYIRDLNQYLFYTTTNIFPKNFCEIPSKLLIVVTSSPQNIDARQAIRETWGSQKTVLGESIEVVFFLGAALNENIQDSVIAESEQFNDIIQENFADSYNNLTLKSSLILKITSRNCLNNTHFLLKTDDDMYVNVPKLIKLLKGLNSNNVLLGKMWCSTKPIKDPLSKWYCPAYIYNQTYYPNFLSGTGYIMSIDVAKKLFDAALTIPLIHLEDIFITGLCARKAGVIPKTNFEFASNILTDDICELKEYITMHHFTPRRLRQIYGKIENDEFLDQCKNGPIFKPFEWLKMTLLVPLSRWKRRKLC